MAGGSGHVPVGRRRPSGRLARGRDDRQRELYAAPRRSGRRGTTARNDSPICWRGRVSALPVWRGDRQFFMRRDPGQRARACCYTVDPDGTERVADRPDRDSTRPACTTLDALPARRKEGDLLAYQVSEGGTEESVLRVIDVATGELVDGPIDRARYSPVAWLPGGRGLLLRAPAGSGDAGCPTARSSSTGACWLHHLGTDPDTDVEIFGDGADGHQLLRRLGEPRRPLAAWSTRLGGHRPAQRPVAGRPRRRRPAATRQLVPVQSDVDAQTVASPSAATAGCTSSPTSTPRAAGCCVADPHTPDGRALARPAPRGPRGRARGLRDPRRRRAGAARCCWRLDHATRSASSRVHDLAHRRAGRRRRRCRAGLRRRACASGPRAATRPGSATPTTPRSPARLPLRRPHRRTGRCGPSPPGAVAVPEVHHRSR